MCVYKWSIFTCSYILIDMVVVNKKGKRKGREGKNNLKEDRACMSTREEERERGGKVVVNYKRRY